jgi:hypothetical protein
VNVGSLPCHNLLGLNGPPFFVRDVGETEGAELDFEVGLADASLDGATAGAALAPGPTAVETETLGTEAAALGLAPSNEAVVAGGAWALVGTAPGAWVAGRTGSGMGGPDSLRVRSHTNPATTPKPTASPKKSDSALPRGGGSFADCGSGARATGAGAAGRGAATGAPAFGSLDWSMLDSSKGLRLMPEASSKLRSTETLIRGCGLSDCGGDCSLATLFFPTNSSARSSTSSRETSCVGSGPVGSARSSRAAASCGCAAPVDALRFAVTLVSSDASEKLDAGRGASLAAVGTRMSIVASASIDAPNAERAAVAGAAGSGTGAATATGAPARRARIAAT